MPDTRSASPRRPTPPGTIAAWRSALRPSQWVKNILVAAAPLAAGVLHEADVLVDVAIAFVCFCLASSAGYLVNDVLDVEEDRRHPSKAGRAIASGRLSMRAAVTSAVLLATCSLALSALTGTWRLGAVLVTYLALTVSYSVWLKHQPVIDLAVVSSGFLLRAVAGGAAADLPLSRWFLVRGRGRIAVHRRWPRDLRTGHARRQRHAQNTRPLHAGVSALRLECVSRGDRDGVLPLGLRGRRLERVASLGSAFGHSLCDRAPAVRRRHR